MVKSGKVKIERLPSGVPRLDDVLGGGVPEYSFNVIAGDPGSGKTTLEAKRGKGTSEFILTLRDSRSNTPLWPYPRLIPIERFRQCGYLSPLLEERIDPLCI